MLIKGMDSLKYCAYVGQESREDMSVEVPELEGHKVLEQYRMADSGYNPSPPMFAQPNARDRSRIMELLKYRNEKRKIIKLLEDKNINTADSQSETVPASIISQVEEALQKILHQEIQSLYREVKNIIFTDTSNRSNSTVANITQKATHKSHWVSKPFDENDAKLVAILAEDIEEEENAAFEMDVEDRPALQVIADGIADDRGRIDHNHLNESESLEESSFSSSEEAMLHCKGVLISQPLVPNGKCKNTTDPTQNVIAYTVEEDSYYYFIFSSANERVSVLFILFTFFIFLVWWHFMEIRHTFWHFLWSKNWTLSHFCYFYLLLLIVGEWPIRSIFYWLSWPIWFSNRFFIGFIRFSFFYFKSWSCISI